MSSDGGGDQRPRPLRPAREPTAPNPSTAAARVLFDEFARCGVRQVVLAPGSRSTALVVAAHDHPDLLVHTEVDERSAAFLALGIGRATGQPAVVVTTSGTAVANLLPAVVEADHDRVPLLLLTADRPAELHGSGANQTIPQVGIFADFPRWAVDLGEPGHDADEVARWRWTACRAHGVAVGRPVEAPAVVDLDAWREPGPVHCNAPFREPTVPVTDDGRSRAQPFTHPLDGMADGAPWATPESSDHVPHEHVLVDLAATLAAEPEGLVVVGGGIDGAVGPVVEVAASLGWPVLAEPHAGVAGDGVLDHGTLLLGTAGFASAHEPALLLQLGRPTVAREVSQLLGRTPRIVLDAHGGWGAADDDTATLVRGAVGSTLSALLPHVEAAAQDPDGDGDTGSWRAVWLEADGRAAAALDAALRDAPGTLDEPRVVRDVAAAVPSGGVLVVGSSMPIRDLDLVGRGRADLAVHANRGASGIDGFTSTALGVAMAHEGPTVAICGDLTLLHDSNAWLLSPDPTVGAVDLVVVVLDNDGGGIFSFLPQRDHVDAFDRLLATPHGRDLGRLAALHDLTLHRPAGAEDVVAAVEEGIASGGRHLVHVRTDREANVTVHRHLRAVVAEALTEE